MYRIALISEHASPLAALGGIDSGGQNVYVAEIAVHLARMGYEVDIFTRRDAAQLPDVVICSPRVRVIHICAGPSVRMAKESLLPFMDDFATEVISFMRKSSRIYDLVHANFFMSGYVAIAVKQALNIPFVVTFHALGKVRRQHQGSHDRFPPERCEIEKEVMDEAEAIIAECPQDKTDLIALYEVDARKIIVIPCGVNPNEFYPVPKREACACIGVKPQERIVLQLGRWVPRKGIETAIRGFSELLRMHQIKARLLIVGGDSPSPDPQLTPELKRLQIITNECGITDSVTFVGARPRCELKYYYSAADAFISTPWYEPFGITPIEAMACGTPVIGSNVGGIKHTVVEGKTGFLIPPRDHTLVGAKLARLFHDDELSERMTSNCVARINEHFTWEKVSAGIAALYRRAMPVHMHFPRSHLAATDLQRRS
ncbi:glycosyltransferase family 1 protein [Sulfuriferula sp. AH1]|uniref:glycosyltransferase family 4 protein n=1 Tax=Sulfuriferula sp. AH1 TaxID=1985873 RepID=UPI0016731520|nr:glycosyltransferase family 1 protein [Sulfuriferula sp. AH1]